MAFVAKPGTYNVRTPSAGGGGGYQTDLGAAVGALGDAFGRATDRREREEKERNRKRDNQLFLAGKNAVADKWNALEASGALDGLTADEVLAQGNEIIAHEKMAIHEHNPEMAEKFDAESSITLNGYVARTRKQEREVAQAELLAQRTQVDIRYKRDLHEIAKDIGTGSPEEQEAAFEQLQILKSDYNRSYADLPPQVRAKYEGIGEAYEREAMLDAAIAQAVRTNSVEELAGRIGNRTDTFGQSGQRFTEGMPTALIAKKLAGARLAASRKHTARANRVAAAKARQDAEDEWSLQGAHLEVRNGLSTRDQVGIRFRMAGRPDLEAKFLDEANDFDTEAHAAAQTDLVQDEDARDRVSAMHSFISVAGDREEVLLLMQQAKDLASGDNPLIADDQEQVVQDLAKARIDYLEYVEDNFDDEQKAGVKAIDAQFKSIMAPAGVFGDAGASVLPGVGKEQVAFYLELKPFVATEILRNGWSDNEVRLWVNEFLPALWDANETKEALDNPLSDETLRKHNRAGAAAGRVVQQSDAQKARAKLERMVETLGRSGFTDNLTHKDWFPIAIDPEYSGHLRYTPEGSVNGMASMLLLENAYGADQAALIWSKVVNPQIGMTQALLGRRTRLQIVKDTDEWMKHMGTT